MGASGSSSMGKAKQQDFEADHSPPSRAEVKNKWSNPSTLLYISYGIMHN
jgi:hypothetical protein